MHWKTGKTDQYLSFSNHSCRFLNFPDIFFNWTIDLRPKVKTCDETFHSDVIMSSFVCSSSSCFSVGESVVADSRGSTTGTWGLWLKPVRWVSCEKAHRLQAPDILWAATNPPTEKLYQHTFIKAGRHCSLFITFAFYVFNKSDKVSFNFTTHLCFRQTLKTFLCRWHLCISFT